MGQRSFFADWTIRHPDIPNGELLQHCGPWPISLAKDKVELTYPLAFEHPGSLTAEAKHGELTLARFDGDNGEYSILLGNAKGVDGPKCMGTYLWIEVDNIKRLEAKIGSGLNPSISASLCTIMASVGVMTLPTFSVCPYRVENNLVAFIPTIQSARSLHSAAR